MSKPVNPWPRRTDRLTLRQVRAEDIERLLQIRTLPGVTRWLIRTEVVPENFGRAWRESVDDPDDFSAVVEVGEMVIGNASLELSDGMGQGGPGGPAERRGEAQIGYVLDPGYAGHGYATEITAELLRVAFDDLGVRRVTAGCFADNLASVRVLEKNRMRREEYGVADSWHAELGWIDGCSYAILADEWRGERQV